VDVQPPTVAISAPPDGGLVSGLFTVDVTASDNVEVRRVELYVNGALLLTDTASPYGFTVDSTAYADGPLVLAARAYDAAGNSATSSTVNVTVSNALPDVTPPTVTITSPADGSTVSGTVTINVQATDNVRVAKIILSIRGRRVSIAFGSTLTYDWTVPSQNAKRRKNTISARAEDAAGNAAATSIVVITERSGLR
jgi:hypothetical protein